MPFTSLVLCNDAEALAALAAAMDAAQIKRELCAGAAHAKKLLSNRKFDAVFFDCDAVEALEELVQCVRQSEQNRNAIIFAIVGEKNTAVASESGANLVLKKPLSVDLISRSLEAVKGFVVREQRRHLRHNVELAIRVSPKANLTLRCEASNISEGGICLQPSSGLRPKQTVSVHFELPELAEPIEAKGEVVWVADDGKAGLRFLQIHDPSHKKLRTWLGRQLQGQLPGMRFDPRSTGPAGQIA